MNVQNAPVMCFVANFCFTRSPVHILSRCGVTIKLLVDIACSTNFRRVCKQCGPADQTSSFGAPVPNPCLRRSGPNLASENRSSVCAQKPNFTRIGL